MKTILNHLITICKHKWWVFYHCYKAGLIWQGIVHDLSKFSFTEFSESVKYYTGTSSPIDNCKRAKGYSMSWMHHRGRNPHHYEYWTDNYDSGTTHLMMPFKYATEMFCDNISAAKTYMGKKFTWEAELNWWHNKQKTAKMHPNTEAYMNNLFNFCYHNQRFPTKEEFKEHWLIITGEEIK